MKLPSSKKIKAFQQKILRWYNNNKRDLPWRKTKDPYKILVSEVMLQQTQVDRVIEYYKKWIKILPTFKKLSTVDTKTLLSRWSGLGYNNRALRLRSLAQTVMQNHQGKLPKTYNELVNLSGIGDYTANAVLAFAHNKEAPVMDTNIRRVLIHELNLSEEISIKELQEVAFACVPKGKSREWHNALMDYGALHKTARATGIKPLSKQGTFKGSDRQVRGFITKELTIKPSLSIRRIKEAFPEKDVDKIVDKIVNEKIITKKKNKVVLT